MQAKGKKVYVGMSGGVDSSVSAYLLKEAGYDVTGVFIKVWQPDFVACTWVEDRLDAMRVAALLNIPFKTLDLEEEYKKGVIDYMLSEYKAGRTPNPDVMCNKEVKFGAFLNWAVKDGADFIATGHYAQNILNTKTGLHELHRSPDKNKDQSYFLWTLTQEMLQRVLFPVGHMKKDEVRKIAERAGLQTAKKKDSQGLCFISNIDMKTFLKHFMQVSRGTVLSEDGEEIGFHDGAIFVTLGERHGFTITKKTPEDAPYYVVAKNIEKNTLMVSHTPPSQSNSKNITLSGVNFVSGHALSSGFYSIATRYHGEEVEAELKAENGVIEFHPKAPILETGGQSLVFFDGPIALGGGVIV
jgi:tRNA-specific 2-thiouridylase